MSTPDVPQPSGRQPTLIELNQHEDRLAAAASLSKNTNGRAAGSQSPFNPSERVETGIAAAAMINQTYAEQQCGWNSGQSKQAASNPPSLDHATTPAFCNAARPSAVELSLFIKSDGPCTKRISLVEGRIISDGSACAILIGQAARVRIDAAESPLQAVASLVANMTSDQALCLGRLIEEACDNCTVVTERRRRENLQSNAISRTQQFLHFKAGEPALMLIDFDRKGMPQEIAARIEGAGSAWNALVGAIPGLGAAGRISRASTSAGLYNSETGERYAGSGGEHHYLLVADGSDIPRALSDLHERAWLSGLGWFMVGGAGQLLDRSIVDRSVGSPERLVFEGTPVLVAPLAQDQSSRQPLVTEGTAIDTREVIPPLSDAERDMARSIKDLARKQLQGEAARVRDQSNRSLARDISERTGIHFETALRQVRVRHDGVLLPPILLELDDTELGTVTVGDVLDNPDRFVGETLADPLEGTAYGRCKAKVMRGDDGEAFIHSFAHGRIIYRLVLDAARLKEKIEAASPKSAVDLFVANLFRAHLEPDELEQLRDYVAGRAGVGVRQIDRRVKAAREARAKTEAERAAAAAPSDKRITFAVPSNDAEMTAVMKRIDEVLRQVNDPEPPMRSVSGRLCEIRTRPAFGLHLLVPHRDRTMAPVDRLPAPAEPLISELDVDHTTMAIERYIRHTCIKGNQTANVRLPMPFARAYQSYAASGLPRVTGVVTAPLVTETGLLATNGLDRALELVFQINPLVLRLIPDPGAISNREAYRAYRFLADEWLCDVLTTEEGKALIIVAALTLMERVLLPERPAFFITAGQRGGGKTTLTNMISLAVLGRLASAASWSESVEAAQGYPCTFARGTGNDRVGQLASWRKYLMPRD